MYTKLWPPVAHTTICRRICVPVRERVVMVGTSSESGDGEDVKWEW